MPTSQAAPTFAMVADPSDTNVPPLSVLESVQLMVDPSTNQHYMVVDSKLFFARSPFSLFSVQIVF